jgi:hypothetical protein
MKNHACIGIEETRTEGLIHALDERDGNATRVDGADRDGIAVSRDRRCRRCARLLPGGACLEPLPQPLRREQIAPRGGHSMRITEILIAVFRRQQEGPQEVPGIGSQRFDVEREGI